MTIKGYEETHRVNMEKMEASRDPFEKVFGEIPKQVTVEELLDREALRLGWEAAKLYNNQPETLQYTRDELVEIIRKAYNRSAGFTFQACAGDVVDALVKAGAVKVKL